MTRPEPAQRGVLVLSCQDAPGIVHAVSGVLLEQGCTIVESWQFHSDVSGDPSSGTFYPRVEFAAADGVALVDSTELDFEQTVAAVLAAVEDQAGIPAVKGGRR